MDWFCSFYHPLTATFSKKKKKPWLSRYLCVSRLPNSLLLSFRSQKLNFAQHFPLNTISTSAHTEPSFALSLPLCQLLLPCSRAPGVALPLSKPEYCPSPLCNQSLSPNFLLTLFQISWSSWSLLANKVEKRYGTQPTVSTILIHPSH